MSLTTIILISLQHTSACNCQRNEKGIFCLFGSWDSYISYLIVSRPIAAGCVCAAKLKEIHICIYICICTQIHMCSVYTALVQIHNGITCQNNSLVTLKADIGERDDAFLYSMYSAC